MLTKSTIVPYLGRPLTSSEDTNFTQYLDIAVQRLEGMLGISLSTTTGARTFPSRDGYRTVFIDPFTAVSAVSIDGNTISTYVKKQGDAYSGSWFDSLEFDDSLHGERVEVTATWGFGSTLPGDLALLLAGLFGSHEAAISPVKRKKIEDADVTYRDTSPLDDVVAAHLSTVWKYSRSDGAIQHGCV